ncbi:interferon-related developmental regulator 1-like [Tropilaelaps mercedesae]|uniref:Interferon-related developmental regulator 1-like n=1 Tax=Tropilaelaps mercedesae TaxID=418985 RepID=A0A1V9XPY8_9ACAR|nr:interferon-related developmental regulator 1-like [Tropilaelaps mercedesae]
MGEGRCKFPETSFREEGGEGESVESVGSSRVGGGRGGGGSQYGSSDDESVDTCSIFSGDSQCPSPHHTRGSQQNTDEDGSYSGPDEVDTYEDKLKEAIDGALAKSGQRRTQCLQALSKAFGDRYCPEFLANRPTTMADVVEKCLKKGKADEQAAAATLAAILVLQYGPEPEGSEIYESLSKIFGTMLADAATAVTVREKIAVALAVAAYIAETDPYHTQEIMEQLRAVFAGSFLKGDGSTPSISPGLSSLHQTALLSWALLLTGIPDDLAYQNINRYATLICGLLQNADVEMRVAAGEALATMFEIARACNSEFEGSDADLDLDDLCTSLHQLATDSQKFRAKKDRKMQKSSFRDIERAVREGDGPELNVQFGVEILRIRTWEDKRTYDALCALLGSGMNHHLQNNPHVRTLFGLGAPLVSSTGSMAPLPRVTKSERHRGNVVADRNRTKRMAKCRDKRLDIV